jgi:hypothetical protein
MIYIFFLDLTDARIMEHLKIQFNCFVCNRTLYKL